MTRGQYPILYSLLQDRDEMTTTIDEEGNSRLLPDWQALFYGRDTSMNACISIGPKDATNHLSITKTVVGDEQTSYLDPLSDFVPTQALRVDYGSNEQVLPWTITRVGQGSVITRRALREVNREEPPPQIESKFLGPGLLDNDELAGLWDGVALRDDERRVVDALRLVFGGSIDRVTVIGDPRSVGRRVGRRAIVKLEGYDDRVPLKSLGDGVLRLFGVALALANSRGGFLLIDEAENGIHYSVQRAFWKMVLQTAHENNVQVLATTHSGDCIRGFVQAATELEDVDGALVRLDRQNGSLSAVSYSEENLRVAAEQGIEVR